MFRNLKKTAAAVFVVAAIAVGGAAIGSAATSSSTTTTTTTAAPSSPPASTMPPHGSAAHEAAEKTVTGDAATKAQAAAVKIVGSGTAGAVTTDYFGTGYEVTVTKSDGSSVEIHLDSSFNELQMPGGPGH
jgi:hypothetical protein